MDREGGRVGGGSSSRKKGRQRHRRHKQNSAASASATTSSRSRECTFCQKKINRLKFTCQKCKSVAYCCRKCQDDDFKRHNQECRRLEVMRRKKEQGTKEQGDKKKNAQQKKEEAEEKKKEQQYFDHVADADQYLKSLLRVDTITTTTREAATAGSSDTNPSLRNEIATSEHKDDHAEPKHALLANSVPTLSSSVSYGENSLQEGREKVSKTKQSGGFAWDVLNDDIEDGPDDEFSEQELTTAGMIYSNNQGETHRKTTSAGGRKCEEKFDGGAQENKGSSKKKDDVASKRYRRKFAAALAGPDDSKSKSKPKAVNSASSVGETKKEAPGKANNKFGAALAELNDKPYLRTVVKPQVLPIPESSGRTTLGDREPDLSLMSQLMDQDIVLHYHPRTDTKYHDELVQYMGVYEPIVGPDRDGFRDFVLSKEKSLSLCIRLAKCNDWTKRQLIERGIFLRAARSYDNGKKMYRYVERDRYGWIVSDGNENMHGSTLIWSTFLCSLCRSGELNYWTDQESLFRSNSEFFMPWQMSRTPIFIAMTPMKNFYRAIEIAAMSSVPQNIVAPIASDFYFWNKTMVLYARAGTDPYTKRMLDPWMGVYVAINQIVDFYPVWKLDAELTSGLMQLLPKVDMQRQLLELGIVLKPDDIATSSDAYMYMYRHVLHVGPIDSPGQNFYLRNACASEKEEQLLTESDALFRVRKKAFSPWTVKAETNSWTQADLAVTPETFFREAMALVDLESDILGGDERLHTEAGPTPDNAVNGHQMKGGNKKKKKKKKKKQNAASSENALPSREAGDTNIFNQVATTNASDEAFDGANCEAESGKQPECRASSSDAQARRHIEKARLHSLIARKRLEIGEIGDDKGDDTESGDEAFEGSLTFLFDTAGEAGFLVLDQALAASIFEATLNANDVPDNIKVWLRSQTDALMTKATEHDFKCFIVSMLKSGVSVSARSLSATFKKLPKDRSNEFNNAIAKSIRAIRVASKDEVLPLSKLVSSRVGKQARKDFSAVLKAGEAVVLSALISKRKTSSTSPTVRQEDAVGYSNAETQPITTSTSEHQSEVAKRGDEAGMDELRSHVDSSLGFYRDMLQQMERQATSAQNPVLDNRAANRELEIGERKIEDTSNVAKEDLRLLSSEEVAEEMAKCSKLPEKKQAEIVSSVEKSMDLFNWDDDSVWTIDITEQAHKWFKKHVKREYALCERVIRRLKLLSIGRWPYVLCKPLKTRKQSVKLYESKIDSGGRIIWEVAVAFSPRRSSANHSYCEQVIRVWDIVQDHDDLSRSIDKAVDRIDNAVDRIDEAVDRIENSHSRGEDCIIFSQIESFDTRNEMASSGASSSRQVLPRVFTMRGIGFNQQTSQDTRQDTRHYPPASDDPNQFTLLKFYELNTGAIKLLLEGKDENTDLPFTPGPKEHEIIHYMSDPPRSVLLMGRSGTGKTTCLVFRMWAQFMAYDDEEARPRQLFVTKNDVLRKEVQKSFLNMSLAWRRKRSESNKIGPLEPEGKKNPAPLTERAIQFPLFLTASEWLELLDRELPGTPFFTLREAEERAACRDQDDAVKRGVEALIAEDDNVVSEKGHEIVRQEMTYIIFRKKWRKINSKVKSSLDPALVWLEIKSFIKGSVEALKHGFLKRDEYLSLPKKKSRTDASLRREVYDLFESYERIKKSGNYFDEMDLVYHLAHRAETFLSPVPSDNHSDIHGPLLPIDSVFVDEVQDFTLAELYILAKLNRDPNNLFLAGDTAQSIAVGVGFRFTDVRQIFYNSFGGIEPSLLQLTFNFRSHVGVLRLAATVVELLYFFFNDSLDRLPPDLGLFKGPLPVIMEAQNPGELVLMLDGSKRETSRIEFGSHQVVIVRNEEAKGLLPDEFGVDKDWVMTVQESKGLEFDDVLLYNFFSDSEAGDLWRVVTNYREKDVAAYYEDASVKSSVVQRYDWDGLLEKKTRDLDFSKEEHKILETELKMLYTAITRARVNVFIAERDVEKSRPMFEYFCRRKVVEVANAQKLEGIRIFGASKHTVEDWKERGEYYLQNATGERKKGCLRLAVKCFEKAGEESRKDYALAILSFVEIEEDQDSAFLKRRDKQNYARRRRFYEIAAQLLEARDVIFLDKAALCLLRAAEDERPRCAEMFELYARLQYLERVSKGNTHGDAPSSHERQYFSYAGKLYERSASLQRISHSDRREFLVRALFNFLCSGGKEDLKQAARLIDSNLRYFKEAFSKLISICVPSEEVRYDPITFYQREIHDSEDGIDIRQALEKLAKIYIVSCRSFNADDDANGMGAALKLIPSSEKIHMLLSLGSDPKDFFRATPWARHSAFSSVWLPLSANPTIAKKAKKMDAIGMLVAELLSQGGYERAAEILEERGQLLGAANLLISLADRTEDSPFLTRLKGRIVDLKARYVDLILSCHGWEKDRPELCSIMESIDSSLEELSSAFVPDTLLMRIDISKAKLLRRDIQAANTVRDGHVMWRYDSIMQALSHSHVGFKDFFRKYWGNDFWKGFSYVMNCVVEMEKAATVLLRPSSSQNPGNASIISQVESYFELQQHQFDPRRVSTLSVTNLKLLKAVQECKKHIETAKLDLPDWTSKLVLVFDREQIHSVLANYLFIKASVLLLLIEKHLKEEGMKSRPCDSIRFGTKCMDGSKCKLSHGALAKTTKYHISVLQAHLLSLEQIQELRKKAERMFPSSFLPGGKLKKCNQSSRSSVTEDLRRYILETNQLSFNLVENVASPKATPGHEVLLRTSVLSVLCKDAKIRWDKSRGHEKKEPINAIRYWKILHLCDKIGDTKMVMESELGKVEKKWSRIDFREGTTDAYINKADTDRMVENPRLLSRLWIYAIDSADEDLFNSIYLVENLIDQNSKRTSLRPMSKFDQITLLEVHSVGIFGAISLRYGEATRGTNELPIFRFLKQFQKPSRACSFLIPQHCYLNCFLKCDGSVNCRTYGVAMKDAISRACHNKDNYFDFFAKCVDRLEHLARTIVENELLCKPRFGQVEELRRFERGFILGAFVCCNAILFSLSGEEMSAQDVTEDLNKFPSIPLCGNIRRLAGNVREALLVCKTSPSLRVQQAFKKMPTNSTVLDVIQATNQLLLNAGWSDKFVLCNLKQSSDGEVEIKSHHDIGDATKIFGKIPFDENRGVFCDSYKPKLRSFLESKERVHEATGAKDISLFCKKSEERKASIVICRFLKSMHQKSRSYATSSQSHFHAWKKVLCCFVRIVKRRMENKLKRIDPTLGEDPQKAITTIQHTSCSLSAIPNILNDVAYLQKCAANLRQNFFDYHSPVYDGIECSFCGIAYSPQKKIERDSWILTQYFPQCYKHGYAKFNYIQFNMPAAPFDTSLMGQGYIQHQYETCHQQNINAWNANNNMLSEVAANIETCLYMMRRIIDTCDDYRNRYQQFRHEVSSWYYNVEEEAKLACLQLEDAQFRLSEGFIWPPRPDFNVLVASLRASCRFAEILVHRIQEEERLLQVNEGDEDEVEALDDGVGPLEDDFIMR